jgi:uncharacterized protein YciI
VQRAPVVVGGSGEAVHVAHAGPDGCTTFLVLFTPTRPGFPEAMTAQEEDALARHFAQLEALTEAGTSVVAGPTLDAALGVWVVDGLPLHRLLDHLRADAMVAGEHFRAEVRAMRLSLERVRPS